MPRPKKTVQSVPVAFRITPEARKRLGAACRKAHVTQADVIRMGIRLFLSGKEVPTNEDRET